MTITTKNEILAVESIQRVDSTVLINNFYKLKSYDKISIVCSECDLEYSYFFHGNADRVLLNICRTCLIKKNNLEKHGYKFFNIEKCRETCIKRYGVDNPFKSNLIIEKSKQTKLKKYGNENYNNREKSKQTCILLYDVENVSQNKKIKRKIGDSNRKISQNAKKTRNKTNLIKYGRENPMHLDKFREKSSRIQKSKFFKSLFEKRLNNMVTPLFSENDYTGVSNIYRWKCNQCGNKFVSDIDDGKIPECKKCFPKSSGSSLLEKEIVNFLKTLDIEIQENNYKIIHPQELDIYIPSKKLAIEFNGTYWHSSILKDRWYHQMKIEKCNRKEIRLLHIYEWEWVQDKQKCIFKIKEYLEDMNKKINVQKPKPVFIKNNKKSNYKDYDHLIWT